MYFRWKTLLAMLLKSLCCVFFPFMFLLTTLSGCKTVQIEQSTPYEFLEYEHTGVQQMEMRVYPGMDRGKLKVLVSSCDFQLIGKSIVLVVSGLTADAFDDYYHTLDGSIDPVSKEKLINKSSSGNLRMRLMHGNKSVEITNPELMERFQLIEDVVRATLQL
jgi:hypothetical protein